MKLNVTEIAARLDAGYLAWEDPGSPYWAWDNALDDLFDAKDSTVTPSAVRAFLVFLTQNQRQEEGFTHEEFTEEFTRRYKEVWPDAEHFARKVAAPDWAEMGEDPNGRGEALKEFADLIDWSGYIERDQFTEQWTGVTLPDEECVHFFEAS